MFAHRNKRTLSCLKEALVVHSVPPLLESLNTFNICIPFFDHVNVFNRCLKSDFVVVVMLVLVLVMLWTRNNGMKFVTLSHIWMKREVVDEK